MTRTYAHVVELLHGSLKKSHLAAQTAQVAAVCQDVEVSDVGPMFVESSRYLSGTDVK
jgi:hypothetical protein